MKRMIFVLAMTGLCAAPVQAARHALLVGVSDYTSDKVRDLEGPANDVRALEEALRHTWKFDHIKTLVDRQASKAAILNALADLERTTQAGDYIFFYFSGHGTSPYDRKFGMSYLKEDPFSGALLPADFRGGRSAEQIRQQLIIGRHDIRPVLERLDADRKLFVVFDACYSGNTVRSLAAHSAHQLQPRAYDLYAEELDDGEDLGSYEDNIAVDEPYPYRNIVYMSASSERETAMDIPQSWVRDFPTIDGRPHGVFTDALLRALSGEANSNRDGALTYEEIHRYAQQRVVELAAHTPKLMSDMSNARQVSERVFDHEAFTEIPDIVGVEGALRVQLEESTAVLRSHLYGIEGLRLVEDGACDLRIAASQGRYYAMLASGEPYKTVGSGQVDSLVAFLRGYVQIKDLLRLQLPQQSFNVFAEILPRDDYLVEGDMLGLEIKSEVPAYYLVLDLDANAELSVLYPFKGDELVPSAHWSGENMFRVQEPFGVDRVLVYAFGQRVPVLDAFFARRKAPIAAGDPLVQELLQTLRQAGSGAAQTQRIVRTRPKN